MLRIQDGSAIVGVVGLGYVGLPLAMACAEKGFCVKGIDASQDVVDRLNQGTSHILDVSSDVVRSVVLQKRFTATCDSAALSEADVILICVPTPLDDYRQPVLTHVRNALGDLLPHIKPPAAIVLESTTYPGTTEEIIVPAVEKAGFRVGRDVFVAFSPERIDPGNDRFKVQQIPKLVGGATRACSEVVSAFYERIIEGGVHVVTSPRTAEMAKLLENVYRAVNISLVNEVALLCERMGIDVWEVIEAASTKPFGFVPFFPGPGLGGHCIPLDPFYLSWKAREHGVRMRFIESAGEIAELMPTHVVKRTIEILNRAGKPAREARILILGMAYKRDIADTRESPAMVIAQALQDLGAKLSFHDPFVLTISIGKENLTSIPLNVGALNEHDLVLILTDHSTIDYASVVDAARLVFDTRNATRGIDSEKIIRLGVGEIADG